MWLEVFLEGYFDFHDQLNTMLLANFGIHGILGPPSLLRIWKEGQFLVPSLH